MYTPFYLALGVVERCGSHRRSGVRVLIGLVIFDGWEVAAIAASSLTAKVARRQAGIGAAGNRR